MERTQRDHYPKHEFYSWVWPGLMALTRCWKHSSEILVHVNMTASSSRCKPSAPPHPTALVLYQDLVALEAFGGCALNSTVFWSSTVSCCWACAPCCLSLLFLVDRNWPSPLFYLPSISVTGAFLSTWSGGRSPLTSLINEVFFSHQRHLAGCLFVFPHLSLWTQERTSQEYGDTTEIKWPLSA